jgi:autophagy-related protein 16-1
MTMTHLSTVAVSSDGSTVASGHQDGGLRIWNIQMATKIHYIPKLHTSHICSVQFDPKRANKILTASKDNTLSIIDTRTYEPLAILRAPGFGVTKEWSQVSPPITHITLFMIIIH